MVKISLSGSGEGPGWVTAPGYSTGPFRAVGAGIGLGMSGADEVRIPMIVNSQIV